MGTTGTFDIDIHHDGLARFGVAHDGRFMICGGCCGGGLCECANLDDGATYSSPDGVPIATVGWCFANPGLRFLSDGDGYTRKKSCNRLLIWQNRAINVPAGTITPGGSADYVLKTIGSPFGSGPFVDGDGIELVSQPYYWECGPSAGYELTSVWAQPSMSQIIAMLASVPAFASLVGTRTILMHAKYITRGVRETFSSPIVWDSVEEGVAIAYRVCLSE